MVLVVKNPPANAGDIRDAGSIPGSERSPGGGYGNPLQYSCLENPVDGGTWQRWGVVGGGQVERATVHEVTKSWKQLKQLSMHAERWYLTQNLNPA